MTVQRSERFYKIKDSAIGDHDPVMRFLGKLYFWIWNLCRRGLSIHMFPKTVATHHFTSRNKPNMGGWGPLTLRNGQYFCALCRAGTCSLVTATRSVTIHLGRSSAFLLWPLLSALSLTPRGINHIPSRSELHQVPPPSRGNLGDAYNLV